jgi:F plasmid transfer operon, TraF, protein
MLQYFVRNRLPGPIRGTAPVILFVLALMFAAAPASAQSDFDGVGTRAQGMGGAFVAVADDSSATWWNPAGLSSIPLVDAGVAFGLSQTGGTGDRAAATTPAWRVRPVSIAVGLPMVGFSYNQLSMSNLAPEPTATAEPGRQDGGPRVTGRLVRTQRVDVTLAQALGDFVVVGASLGALRGSVASTAVDPAAAADAALDRTEDLSSSARTRFDAHAGALLFAGPLRFGIVVRNLTAPSFSDQAGDEYQVRRQVRVGVAYGSGAPVYQRRPWVVAVDADLTSVPAPDGDRRAVSLGAEHWWAHGRLALRGGGRAQTTGDARPEAAAGGSVAVRSGLLLEARVSGGADRSAAGWSVAARVTF